MNASQVFQHISAELAMQPDASGVRVAREHGIDANRVFAWRIRQVAGQLVAGGPVQLPNSYLRWRGNARARIRHRAV